MCEIAQRFECERISSTEAGRVLESFEVPTLDDIPGVLATGPVSELKDKWSKEGPESSIYLIKTKDDNGKFVGVYSFLLSCGILFEKFLKDLKGAVNGNIVDVSYDEEGRERENKIQLAILDSKLPNGIPEVVDSQSEECCEIPANRITKSHPAVKIEYWAKNYAQTAKNIEMKYCDDFNRKLGEDVFWHFIAGKILEGTERFYSEYCYLFSADNSTQEKLTKYYERLGFQRIDKLNVLCSDDDDSCQCLVMSIRGMRERYKRMANHSLAQLK